MQNDNRGYATYDEVNPQLNINMFKTEILDSKALIDDAAALLHTTYIEQGHWRFSPDNPSQIRIENHHGRNLLVDRFTYSARWFGVFDGETLIGCARLHGMDPAGKYEIEGYSNSQIVWPYLSRENCMEMGKVAVSPAYKGRRIINLIYLTVFEYCQRNRYSVFGGVGNQYIKTLFHRVKLNPKIEQAFKYEETDPQPVSFFFVDYDRGDFKTITQNLRATLNPNDRRSFYSVMDALEILVPLLPVPAYWMGRDGTVLGINELCLKGMGAEYQNIIGRTPHDFYPREVAEHILSHNDLVMRTEQIMSQDEAIKNLSTGEIVYAKALKMPLYDDNGNVIGIIGTSVDLTAEKRVEQLKLETEIQKVQLAEKEKFVLITRKFAHDIASPLLTMKMMSPIFKNVPEPQGKTFNCALSNLMQIADHLLATYRRAETMPINDDEARQNVIVYEQVAQLIEEKKFQNEGNGVVFDLQIESGAHQALANLQVTQFRRAVSNIMNNAVDALNEISGGIVTVKLLANESHITLTIQDNGKGMPEAVRQKILAGNKVTEGKEKGNGLGMQQVWDLLNQNNGAMKIHSDAGYGTSIQIIFPRV